MAEIDRSLLGVWGAETVMRIESGKIREFARAVKDPNPAYLDDEGALAPPTFLMTIAHWMRDLGETRSAVTLDYRRLLHGEQEFEYLAPIHAGDVLTATGRVSDVFEKPGSRGGAMTFGVIETTFTNQRGEKVLISRSTLIETAAPVKKE